MKNYIYICLLSLLSLFTNSCEVEDALLNLDNPAILNDQNLYASESGIEAAVNGIYSSFLQNNYNGSKFYWVLTGNAAYFNANGSAADYSKMAHSYSSREVGQMWDAIYQTIANANMTIYNLKLHENDGYSNYDRVIGQAYFLRALCYFDLVRVWGEVPLRTEPTSGSTLYLPRASREVVYNQIIKDLKLAESYLPSGTYMVGRPIKSAANAYLAKVYMELASKIDAKANSAESYDTSYNTVDVSEISEFSVGESYSNFWEAAKVEALKVVNSGSYQLNDTYKDIYGENHLENTQESIFELPFYSAVAQSFGFHSKITLPADSEHSTTSSGGNIMISSAMLKKHVGKYSSTSNTTDVDIATVNTDADRDPRIDLTYIYNSYLTRVNGVVGTGTKKVYPQVNTGKNGGNPIIKYKEWAILNPNSIQDLDNSSINRIHMRYAEVLLMLAEIENELGNQSQALNYVNQVMSRARNTSSGTTVYPQNWITMSQSDFRIAIMDEYFYELLGEGLEWFTERRRGLEWYKTFVSNRDNAIEVEDAEWQVKYGGLNLDKYMLFPIPLSEISANIAINSNNQNPGW